MVINLLCGRGEDHLLLEVNIEYVYMELTILI